METHDHKEEKNKRIGWITSVGVQLLLLVLFYFLIAWKAPFPPIPEYGIELGFTTSAGASAPAAQQNQVEEVTESEEVVDEVQPAEENVEEAIESTNEEVVEQEEAVVEETEDLPVEEQEPVEEEPVEEVMEEQQEEVSPTVDDRAVMPPTASDADGTNEQDSEGEEEKEEIDERALYGSQGSNTGSNEGASLALAGWMWDFKPEPDDSSDQSGRIVYRIVVDQDGYLVKIETVTSTVSPAVERSYRSAVQKLTFSKTGDYKSAPLSTGTITFIIKSK